MQSEQQPQSLSCSTLSWDIEVGVVEVGAGIEPVAREGEVSKDIDDG